MNARKPSLHLVTSISSQESAASTTEEALHSDADHHSAHEVSHSDDERSGSRTDDEQSSIMDSYNKIWESVPAQKSGSSGKSTSNMSPIVQSSIADTKCLPSYQLSNFTNDQHSSPLRMNELVSLTDSLHTEEAQKQQLQSIQATLRLVKNLNQFRESSMAPSGQNQNSSMIQGQDFSLFSESFISGNQGESNVQDSEGKTLEQPFQSQIQDQLQELAASIARSVQEHSYLAPNGQGMANLSCPTPAYGIQQTSAALPPWWCLRATTMQNGDFRSIQRAKANSYNYQLTQQFGQVPAFEVGVRFAACGPQFVGRSGNPSQSITQLIHRPLSFHSLPILCSPGQAIIGAPLRHQPTQPRALLSLVQQMKTLLLKRHASRRRMTIAMISLEASIVFLIKSCLIKELFKILHSAHSESEQRRFGINQTERLANSSDDVINQMWIPS
ncbi:hypothetical protein FGO68_gene16908 [Halteria grandinella]|uniref:Uncharacterized protein n=1 Tax=Halteria grandinella TaxID=5974 RepID=A0A8J8P5D4_HALGN|nr:hypothetical protein FGO68_gene16908 [Halteria grandinella]